MAEMIKTLQDQSTSFDAIIQASIKEKELSIETHPLREKQLNLAMRQKEYNEKESKCQRLHQSLLLFQQEKKSDLEREK